MVNYRMTHYLFLQAKGQIDVIWNTESVEQVLADPQTSDEVRYKLNLIEEVKVFAEEKLCLTPGTNYTTYYDQKGLPILWALTACEPYSLQPYKWDYPILGKLDYKGFFDKEVGIKEMNQLREKGYDVDLGEVSAWSTLGILSDPVLSSMLELDTGKLVRLILHETTHATLYISGDAAFNENLATYVGDQGALQFMKEKYGEESGEYLSYVGLLEDINTFSGYTVSFTQSLNELYHSLPEDQTYWGAIKQKAIQGYKDGLYKQLFNKPSRYRKLSKYELNNTFFTSFLLYRNQQDSIAKICEEQYAGKICKMIEGFKD